MTLIILSIMSISCVNKSTKNNKTNNKKEDLKLVEQRKVMLNYLKTNELVPSTYKKNKQVIAKTIVVTAPLYLTSSKSLNITHTSIDEFDSKITQNFNINDTIYIKIRNITNRDLLGCIEFISNEDRKMGKKFSLCATKTINNKNYKPINNHSSLFSETWEYSQSKQQYITKTGFTGTIVGQYKLSVFSQSSQKSNAEIIINTIKSPKAEEGNTNKNGKIVSVANWKNKNDMIYHVKYYSQQKVLTTMVVVPLKKTPVTGFPLFVWMHGTKGLAEKCNPSKRGYGFPTFKRDRNFITIIPDYDINPHQYYTSEHAARAVFDAMRALKNIPAINVNFKKSVLSGLSQGGHVLFKTLEIHQEYAPEFNFLRAIAFSPGSDGLGHLKNMADYYVKNNGHPFVSLVATMLFAVAETEGNLKAFDAIFKKGQDYRYIKGSCVADFFGDGIYRNSTFNFTEDFKRRAMINDWDNTIYKGWFDKRMAGHLKTKIPIIVVNGLLDNLTGPKETQNLVNRLRGYGNNVTHYPLKDHHHDLLTKPIIDELHKVLKKDFFQ